jgi:hypothetical protein
MLIVAIDEDVAAVEVTVDDAGVMGVEVVESLEDLPRPLLSALMETWWLSYRYSQLDTVRCHLDASLLVEATVNLLDGAQPEDIGISLEPTHRLHLLERLLPALVPRFHRPYLLSSS